MLATIAQEHMVSAVPWRPAVISVPQDRAPGLTLSILPGYACCHAVDKWTYAAPAHFAVQACGVYGNQGRKKVCCMWLQCVLCECCVLATLLLTGTVAYTAKELLLAGRMTHATDIYSFGLMSEQQHQRLSELCIVSLLKIQYAHPVPACEAPPAWFSAAGIVVAWLVHYFNGAPAFLYVCSVGAVYG